VVPLIEENIRLNPPSAGSGGLAEAAGHLWGTVPSPLRPPFDTIVLADVVYDPQGYEPLLASLRALSGGEGAVWSLWRVHWECD
jgi:hypothetical protein